MPDETPLEQLLLLCLPVVFGIAITSMAVYDAYSEISSVGVLGFFLIIVGRAVSYEGTHERVGESYGLLTHTIYYRTKPIEEWGVQSTIGTMISLIGLGMMIGALLLWKPIDFLLGIGIVFGIPYIIKHLLESYPPLNYVVSVIGVSIGIYFLSSIIDLNYSPAFFIGAVMGFYFLVLAWRLNV